MGRSSKNANNVASMDAEISPKKEEYAGDTVQKRDPGQIAIPMTSPLHSDFTGINYEETTPPFSNRRRRASATSRGQDKSRIPPYTSSTSPQVIHCQVIEKSFNVQTHLQFRLVGSAAALMKTLQMMQGTLFLNVIFPFTTPKPCAINTCCL